MSFKEKKSTATVQIMHDTGTLLTDIPDYLDYHTTIRVGDDISTGSKAVWAWKEDSQHTFMHASTAILPNTEFVKYLPDTSTLIEDCYQLWLGGDSTMKTIKVPGGQKVRHLHTGSGYEIDFEDMAQTNLKSNFTRSIRRELHFSNVGSNTANIQLPLPPDVLLELLPPHGYDYLPTFQGQVIQLSKMSEDKSGRMAKLCLTRRVRDQPRVGSNPRVGSHHVWEEKAGVKALLQRALSPQGGGLHVNTPASWEAGKEGRIIVPTSTQEYKDAERFFLTSMSGYDDAAVVLRIERVQSKALWQPYVAKLDAMKAHYAKHPDQLIKNMDQNGLERKWLFHGTDRPTVAKIIKNGFNRSFAGRNAVKYGKGAYFARDAPYSDNFAAADVKGVQRMFLCRVAVGDWCKGSKGQLTPDSKPGGELYDSTVDDEVDPSIFVAYHDAQAYPEYLVSYR